MRSSSLRSSLKRQTLGVGGTTNEIVDFAGQAAPPLPPLLPTDTSPYDISPNNNEPSVASYKTQQHTQLNKKPILKSIFCATLIKHSTNEWSQKFYSA